MSMNMKQITQFKQQNRMNGLEIVKRAQSKQMLKHNQTK